MDNQKVAKGFDKAIKDSDEISRGYSSGCMNSVVAVHELCDERFGFHPNVIAFERPFSLQSTVDHFIIAFGSFSVGELRNIESFIDNGDTWYVDTKGSHSDIESIVNSLYEDAETRLEAGIFEESVSRVKESPHYDMEIKNRFKESIDESLDI